MPLELNIKDDCKIINFTPGNHQYRADKRSVPSVTGIIGVLDKPALLSWAAKLSAQYVIDKIPDIISGKVKFSADNAGEIFQAAKAEHSKVSQQAKDAGTETHDAVEASLLGQKVPKLKGEPKKAYAAFQEWRKAHNIEEVIATETVIFHPEHWYAGKMDMLVKKDGGLWLIDLKTSKSFYDMEMAMQLSAYKAALERMTGLKIDGTGIIRLDKETGWPYWRNYTSCMDFSFEMFTCLAKFENLRRQNAKGYEQAKVA